MNLPVVITEIVALAERLGVKNIKDLPGCWEHQVDARWWFAMNGAKQRRFTTARGMGAYTVEPYQVVIEYNGWPAGSLDFGGNGVIASGEGANEDAFIAALRAAGKKEAAK